MRDTIRIPVGYEIAPPDHIVGEDDLWTGVKGQYWYPSPFCKVGTRVESSSKESIFIRPIQQPKQEEPTIPVPPEGYELVTDSNYVYKDGDYFWNSNWVRCGITVGDTIGSLYTRDSDPFPFAATKIVEKETVQKHADLLTERYVMSKDLLQNYSMTSGLEKKMSEEKKIAKIQEEHSFNLNWCNQPKFRLICWPDNENYNFEFESLEEADFSRAGIIGLFDELIDGLSQMRLRVLKDVK